MGDNVFRLTTSDNPYNPFTQWNEWYSFDEGHGYHTCGYLARIANVSDELSDADESIAIDRAINEILTYNLTGLYIKVTEEGFEKAIELAKSSNKT